MKDDLHGARPACPVAVKEGVACDLSLWKEGENGALFAPQGGLRISARGLARVGRMLLNEGTLDGVTIISAHSVDTLLAPLWRYDGTNGDPDPGYYCSFGLASQQIPAGSHGCSDDMGTRGVTLVGHAGDAYGMKSGLWLDRRGGRGIAYFVTGVPEKARRDGHSAWSAAEVGTFRRTYAKLMKVTQTSSNR